MAARTRRTTQNKKTREKIQASQLINRLTDHVNGKADMKASQVTAALGLLKKAIPDLQAVSYKDGEGNAMVPVFAMMLNGKTKN